MQHRRTILIALFIAALLGLSLLGVAALKNQQSVIEVAIAPIAPRSEEPAEAPVAPYTVSFLCEDSSSFTATFDPATGEEVEIRSSGSHVRTLEPETDQAGAYRADDGVRYAFSGENVTVTLADRSTFCTQPVDPENAPYNFGDAE